MEGREGEEREAGGGEERMSGRGRATEGSGEVAKDVERQPKRQRAKGRGGEVQKTAGDQGAHPAI